MEGWNRRDDDGHKFLVPQDHLARFDEILERYRKTKRFTDAYYDAEAEFCNEFERFMVG